MTWPEFVTKVEAEFRSKQIDPAKAEIGRIDWSPVGYDEQEVGMYITHINPETQEVDQVEIE